MAVGSRVLLIGCFVLGLLLSCQDNKKDWNFNQLACATKISLRCRLTMDEEESIAQHGRGKVISACYNSGRGRNRIKTLVWYILPNASGLCNMDFALSSSTNTLHNFPTTSTEPDIYYWCSICHCCSKISCQLILGVIIRRKIKTFNEMTKLYSYQCWNQEWKVLTQ